MTGEQVRSEIASLNAQTDEFIKQGVFVLNNKIKQNEEKIIELQGKCPHRFVNNKCEYCGKVWNK